MRYISATNLVGLSRRSSRKNSDRCASNRSRAQGVEHMSEKLGGRITAPGIYDLDDDDYHQDPAPEPSLSSSIVKLLDQQTPAHAYAAHPRLNPQFAEKRS